MTGSFVSRQSCTNLDSNIAHTPVFLCKIPEKICADYLRIYGNHFNNFCYWNKNYTSKLTLGEVGRDGLLSGLWTGLNVVGFPRVLWESSTSLFISASVPGSAFFLMGLTTSPWLCVAAAALRLLRIRCSMVSCIEWWRCRVCVYVVLPPYDVDDVITSCWSTGLDAMLGAERVCSGEISSRQWDVESKL